MIWGEIENSNSNFECLGGNENSNFEGLWEMEMQIITGMIDQKDLASLVNR